MGPKPQDERRGNSQKCQGLQRYSLHQSRRWLSRDPKTCTPGSASRFCQPASREAPHTTKEARGWSARNCKDACTPPPPPKHARHTKKKNATHVLLTVRQLRSPGGTQFGDSCCKDDIAQVNPSPPPSPYKFNSNPIKNTCLQCLRLILLCRQHCRLHLTVGRIGQNLKTLSPPQRNKKLKSLQQQLLVPASVYDRVVSTACLLPQNSITHLPNPLPATIMAADTAVGLAPDLLYANEHLAPAKTRSINSPPPLTHKTSAQKLHAMLTAGCVQVLKCR